jgi:hypothetical protein
MPTVTLSREWTDLHGNTHPAGTVLQVDDVTAARLQADGYLDALGGGAAQPPEEMSEDGQASWKSPSRTWKSPSARTQEWKSPSAAPDEPDGATAREPDTEPDAEVPSSTPAGTGSVWKSPSGSP